MRDVRARGITLVEVLIAMAVLVLLCVAALPGLQTYVQQARLRDAGTSLLAHALFAQSEAMKRHATVRLDVAESTVKVIALDGDSPLLLRSQTFPDGVDAARTASIGFGAEGRPVPAGEDFRIGLRPSSASCGELGCPELQVDAGGAVRLCRREGCR
jgi:type IV fimbrial biogenesis protein FimT